MENKQAFENRLATDKIAAKQTERALAHYHAHYDNSVYTRSTRGMSVAHANKLLDDALTICGDPHFKLSRTAWNAKAREFLALFI